MKKIFLTASTCFMTLIFSVAVYACLPLDEGDHYYVSKFGLPLGTSDAYMKEHCIQYVNLQNQIVRQGYYEGSSFEYKHYWCIHPNEDQEYEIIYNPAMDTYYKHYNFGFIVNADWHELIIGLIDSLILPVFDQAMKDRMNNGNPYCDPLCIDESGINGYVANFYHEDMVLSVGVTDLKLTYNSNNQEWNSTLDTALDILSDPNYADKVAELRLPDGKVVPIISSQDAFVCSSNGALAWEDTLTDELVVELLDRVYRFFPDGKLKNLFLTELNNLVNITYDGNNIIVQDENNGVGYTTIVDHNGKPIVVTSNNGVTTPTETKLSWRTDGMLQSKSTNNNATTYLYEDENNPKLLTGIVNEKGNVKKKMIYDDQGRIIRTYKVNAEGNIINDLEVDYTHINDPEPYVRTIDGNGLVVDKYFKEYFGVYKTTKIVQKPNSSSPIILTKRKYNKLGHLIEVTNALGSKTTIQRDGLGRQLSKTEAVGTNVEKISTTMWNDKCGKIESTTVVNRKTTYIYDSSCRLIKNTVSEI